VAGAKSAWINNALTFAAQREDLYSGCRKILRNRTVSFPLDLSGLQLSDAGYTSSKLKMLVKNYLHEESLKTAVDLWQLRLEKAKYGSVSFTTFNHFVKGKGTLNEILEKKSKRASVFGPCIQSVVITWISRKEVQVDVFYRTTEWLKKFPADIVLIRDVLLAPFKLDKFTGQVNFHFANITIHPMYFVTILPHLEKPTMVLEGLKKKDKYFHDWVVKWSARYLCPQYSRGIQKFAQAMRVKKDAEERLDKQTIKNLQKYLVTNHPGHRNDYEGDEDEE